MALLILLSISPSWTLAQSFGGYGSGPDLSGGYLQQQQNNEVSEIPESFLGHTEGNLENGSHEKISKLSAIKFVCLNII